MFRDALATGGIANAPKLIDIAQIAAARLGEPATTGTAADPS